MVAGRLSKEVICSILTDTGYVNDTADLTNPYQRMHITERLYERQKWRFAVLYEWSEYLQ